MPGLYDITPFSLLDYPGEMSCIVWFAGCNMRCQYCHNPAIVTGKGEKDEAKLLAFLEKRVGKLSAVVLSGGEATLFPQIVELARKIKAMGFKIKLDTNGSRPKVLRQLLDEKLLSYVAMDYKCPLELAQNIIGTVKHWEPFRESLAMMIEEAAREGGPKFEVRTTVSTDLMAERELNWIIHDLDQMGYRGTYYIQNIFSHGEKTIGNIAKPERELDKSKLTKPKNFELGFRNF